MAVGREISEFVLNLETSPGPPTVPPSPIGEGISLFVHEVVEASPGPPNTPPNPVVGALISEFVLSLEANPGPPGLPPSPVVGERVSAFAHELVGVNPGPPEIDLVGVDSLHADWLLG